jgi:hypothetical protein
MLPPEISVAGCANCQHGSSLHGGGTPGENRVSASVAVVIIHRLYAVQGRETSVSDASTKEHSVQGTLRSKRNVRGHHGRRNVVIESF